MVNYLKEFSARDLIKVYSFVIMLIMFISFGNNFKKMARKQHREVF
jgi:hypothetical protein